MATNRDYSGEISQETINKLGVIPANRCGFVYCPDDDSIPIHYSWRVDFNFPISGNENHKATSQYIATHKKNVTTDPNSPPIEQDVHGLRLKPFDAIGNNPIKFDLKTIAELSKELTSQLRKDPKNKSISIQEIIKGCNGRAVRNSNLGIFGRLRTTIPENSGTTNANYAFFKYAIEQLKEDDQKTILNEFLLSTFPLTDNLNLNFASTPPVNYDVLPHPIKEDDWHVLMRSNLGCVIRKDGTDIANNKTTPFYEEWRMAISPFSNHGMRDIDLFFINMWPKRIKVNTAISSGDQLVEDDVLAPMTFTIPNSWVKGNNKNDIGYQLVDIVIDPDCTDNC